MTTECEITSGTVTCDQFQRCPKARLRPKRFLDFCADFDFLTQTEEAYIKIVKHPTQNLPDNTLSRQKQLAF